MTILQKGIDHLQWRQFKYSFMCNSISLSRLVRVSAIQIESSNGASKLSNEAWKTNLDAHKRIFKMSAIMKVVCTTECLYIPVQYGHEFCKLIFNEENSK